MPATPDHRQPLRLSALLTSNAPGVAVLRISTLAGLVLLVVLPLAVASAPAWLLPVLLALVVVVSAVAAAALLHQAQASPDLRETAPAPGIDRTADIRELFGHHETAQEEERRAIARAIHDDLGSGLTALNMHLAILFQQMPVEQKLTERAAQAKAMLGSVAEATRRIHRGLRPDKLDVFGFKTAVAEQAHEFEKQSGIACNVSLPDEALDYTSKIDIALFRMVQEALDNVARHAGATKVSVVLDDTDDEIVLSVRDDGRGITVAQRDSLATHGLRSMRERAAYLGGAVEVNGATDGGTTVTIRIPKPMGVAADAAQESQAA